MINMIRYLFIFHYFSFVN